MKRILPSIAFLILLNLTSWAQVVPIQWQKTYGGTSDEIGTSMQYTNDGGYIVVGYSGSNDGDVTGNHGAEDYWVVKVDANGGVEWENSYGGLKNDQANAVQQTTDGGYIVAGVSWSKTGDVHGHHGTTLMPDIWV